MAERVQRGSLRKESKGDVNFLFHHVTATINYLYNKPVSIHNTLVWLSVNGYSPPPDSPPTPGHDDRVEIDGKRGR